MRQLERWHPSKPGLKRPDGLKPNAHIRELARPFSKEALGVLVDIMRDEDAPPGARLIAANGVLDRAWGKPKEHVEITDDRASEVRDALSKISAGDLEGLLRQVRAIDVQATVERLPPPAHVAESAADVAGGSSADPTDGSDTD